MRIFFGIFVDPNRLVIKQENCQDCQIAFQILVFWENECASKHREQEIFGQNFTPNQLVLVQHDRLVNLGDEKKIWNK